MHDAHEIVSLLLENEDDLGADMMKIMGGQPATAQVEDYTSTKYPNGRELRQYDDGGVHYLLNGQHHREDGPAIEGPDGSKEWYLNGQLHRWDGPAVTTADGSKSWWLNNELHREDGPAVEFADGSKEWYLNYQLHREDGPAIERADGSREWYLDDEPMTQEEHAQRTQNR